MWKRKRKPHLEKDGVVVVEVQRGEVTLVLPIIVDNLHALVPSKYVVVLLWANVQCPVLTCIRVCRVGC